ncbi:hypothetical protein [Yersinia aldovae]|uniref:hypothetical protein n=1 Tax=Yersinia aldovae TaxID=29483 RepID=UPI0005ABC4E3|nr:hypothetical protein [Yersinia aldovae]AJJ64430.1 hypothetical protein AT01_1318 [Yersinia aldovae 670-83]
MGGIGKFFSSALSSVLKPISGILGGGEGDATVIQTPAVEEFPTEDTEAVTRARRRKTAEQQARSGRSSTILSGGSDKLGG